MERVPINEIVRRLNTQGILTPSHERRQKGILTNDAQMGGQYWQSRTVLKILSSEVYMGDLVQGKSQTVDHKQRPASAEHHITVRDTHEALISREMFAEVQRIRAEAGEEAKAVRKKHFTPNMFIGKVFCAHCGRALHRQWAARKVMPDRYTYYCLTNSRYERGVCPGICIEEQELRAIVTELLIRAINLELGKSVSGLKKAASQDIEEVIRKEISSKHQELERNRKFLRGLFEHLVQHLITQEEYQSMKDDYDAKVSSLVGEIEALTKEQARLQEKSEKSAGLKSDAEYLTAHRELTADLIVRLIDRIEIDHEHHVTVDQDAYMTEKQSCDDELQQIQSTMRMIATRQQEAQENMETEAIRHEVMSAESLTQAIAEKVIKKVTVFHDHRIEIEYAVQDFLKGGNSVLERAGG